MFRLLAHPERQNEKKLVRRARHRYEHPPMFYPDMTVHHQRTTRQSMLRIKKQNEC
jgi:hypothetical protein